MRVLLCALCALCAAVPATLKDTVHTNTLDPGANTSTAAASPECAIYPGLSNTAATTALYDWEFLRRYFGDGQL